MHQVEASCELNYSDRLRTSWEVATGSLSQILWMCAFPVAGVVTAWVIAHSRHNSVWVYLFLAWCSGAVPVAFFWNAFASGRALRGQGTFSYRFNQEGVHISTQAVDLTRRWPSIPLVRKTRHALYVYVTDTRVHTIPLRALPDGAIESIRELALAGGVPRVDA